MFQSEGSRKRLGVVQRIVVATAQAFIQDLSISLYCGSFLGILRFLNVHFGFQLANELSENSDARLHV